MKRRNREVRETGREQPVAPTAQRSAGRASPPRPGPRGDARPAERWAVGATGRPRPGDERSGTAARAGRALPNNETLDLSSGQVSVRRGSSSGQTRRVAAQERTGPAGGAVGPPAILFNCGRLDAVALE